MAECAIGLSVRSVDEGWVWCLITPFRVKWGAGCASAWNTGKGVTEGCLRAKVWYDRGVDPVSKYANSREVSLWDKMVLERGGLPTILSNPRGLHIWLDQPDRPFRVFV